MSRDRLQDDSLPEAAAFLPALANAATAADLEQYWLNADALYAYVMNSSPRTIQQLITGTELFEVLCSSLNSSLQLLVTPALSSAAAAAAAAAASDASLNVLASLIRSTGMLLKHATEMAALAPTVAYTAC
jgi:hypothetical protein